MALGGRVGRRIAGAVGLGGPLLAAQGIASLVDQMKAFVAALSPAVVQQFDTAMKDLSATVGQAFLPAFQVLTGVIRSIADQLSPLMQALAPVFEEIAAVIGARVVGAVRAVAVLFEALLPLLEQFISIQAQLSEVLMAMETVIVGVVSAVVAMIVPLFASLRPVINGMIDGLKWLTKEVILAAVYLAKAFNPVGDKGGTTFGDMIADALDGLKEGGRAIASQPPAMKGLEQIGKDLALASAAAMGGAGEAEDPNAWQKELAAAVREANQNGKDLKTWLHEEWNYVAGLIAKRLREIPPAVAQGARDAASAVGINDTAQNAIAGGFVTQGGVGKVLDKIGEWWG